MPRSLTLQLPDDVVAALEREGGAQGRSLEDLAASRLTDAVAAPAHTLFQVSTSGALVAGVFQRQVSIGQLLDHGDFGVGTFEQMDGELVVLDGKAYQVHGTGKVEEAPRDRGVPFGVVTRFSGGAPTTFRDVKAIGDLNARIDGLRVSDNIFYAVRVDGNFSKMRVRALKPSTSGGLLEAAGVQAEFELDDVAGTMVGIWSPGYATAFSIRGYHFHFLTADRTGGGHVLDAVSGEVAVRIEKVDDFHLSLQETPTFLKADLSQDVSTQVDEAEHSY